MSRELKERLSQHLKKLKALKKDLQDYSLRQTVLKKLACLKI